MDVQLRKGELVTCEAPIKRLILYLNRKGQFGRVHDIDENHVLMEKEYIAALRLEVERVLEENVFNIEDLKK